jgi:L,D-transpeptidase ErfK/SrfK
MVKGESLSKSFMLLCFSAATLLIPVQQQAAVSIPTNMEAKPLMNLPPIEEPGSFLPYEQTSPRTPSTTRSVVPTHDTHLIIKLRDRRVYLYRNNKLQTSYPVAIGKAGWETPTGSFKVLQTQRDPAWQHPFSGKIIPPGRDNPLGAGWIGFWTDGTNQIGFHGTPNERLVGQAVSHGCVRMRNKDILALLKQVDVGTPVTVQP